MTGVISTARITHASPATTFAHASHRDWEADVDLPEGAEECTDIASQLIDADLNKEIRVRTLIYNATCTFVFNFF